MTFKPGQSGNPKGRPKGSKSMTTRLRDALLAQDVDGAQLMDDIIIVAVKLARAGDPKMIQFLWERLEGKAIQPTSEVKDWDKILKEVYDTPETKSSKDKGKDKLEPKQVADGSGEKPEQVQDDSSGT